MKSLVTVVLASFILSTSHAQISLVKNINPILNQYGRIVKLGNHAYFGSWETGVLGLFKTDGTPTGTLRVTDPNTNIWVKEPTSSGTFIGWSGPNLGGSGEYPWVSDGTTASSVGFNNFVQTLYPYNGEIFYAGHTFDEGFELWKINAAGTAEMVKSLPGVGINNTLTPSKFVVHSDGFLYFLAWANNAPCALWRTNGTTAGTIKIKDIPNMTELLSAGSNLFLFGPNGSGNHKLWVSDGTETGTVVIKDFNPADFPTSSNYYTFNDRLFFTLDDQINGSELWMSNGTTLGTQMVENLNPGAASSFATPLGHEGGNLYVAANNGTIGPALYKITANPIITGGVPQYAFTLVKDMNTVSDATSYFDKGIAFQGKFYFSAGNGDGNSELCRTDGTNAGTEVLGGSYPKNYCVLNSKLLFANYNPASFNFELYKYEDPTFEPCANTAAYQGVASDILYEANSSIISIQTVPALSGYTIYKAQAITLDPGFKTDPGAKFRTVVGSCN